MTPEFRCQAARMPFASSHPLGDAAFISQVVWCFMRSAGMAPAVAPGAGRDDVAGRDLPAVLRGKKMLGGASQLCCLGN